MPSTFSVDLRKACEVMKISLDDGVRKVGLEVLSGVVRMTPVDTGHLRSNWQVGLDNIPRGDLASVDQAGSGTIARESPAVMKANAGGVVYFANNLPYALVVEMGLYQPGFGPNTVGGYSKQAPAGMARITLQRVAGTINQILQGGAP